MDKQLKQILLDIEFTPRYLDLWNQNKALEGESHLLQEEVIDIFNELGLPVKFDKKEKFFKHLEREEKTDFQLNVIIRYDVVAFVLYVFSEEHNIEAGGTYGGFANKLDKRLKVYPKIAFNDYESLQEVLKKGIGLFSEIKEEYLKIIGTQ